MSELVKVTKEDISKVENCLLNTQQANLLLGGTPKSQIYERPAKGGGKWSYVTGTYVKKVLNLMFGWDWDFEVVEHKIDINIGQAYVLGKLTVRTNGRAIVKMQFGRVDIKFKTDWIEGKRVPTNKPLDVGNDLKAATTDALKKCASELGIASDVYAPNEFKSIRIVEKEKTELNYAEMKAEIEKLIVDTNHGIEVIDAINDILKNEKKERYEEVLTLLKK